MLTGLAFRREHSLPPGDLSPGSHLPGPAPELNRRRSRAEQVRRLSCGSRGSPRVRRRRHTPSPEVTGKGRVILHRSQEETTHAQSGGDR